MPNTTNRKDTVVQCHRLYTLFAIRVQTKYNHKTKVQNTKHRHVVAIDESTTTAEETSQSARPLLVLSVALAFRRCCFWLDIFVLAHPALCARALFALLFLALALQAAFAPLIMF